ncbi:MAG TPA: DUF2889 domain-containing protein [Acidimicrobiales bacterium]|nr:DUF2889 domain-containing protein [Acidimicrobiales bacterium]
MAISSVRFIDPRHGTHDPTSGTPARLPGSVRRTTTTDSLRPHGFRGLTLAGRGRDLLTRPDGSAEVLATAMTEVEIEYAEGPVVRAVRAEPPADGLDSLVGRIASTGFRAVIDGAVSVPPGSLVYLLLDEIPACTLVSGYAVSQAVARGALDQAGMTGLRPPGPVLQVADLCSGWRAGGTIMTELEQTARAPVVTGPEALALDDPGDPLAWHAAPGLGADEMRRARRHDLWRDGDGLLHADILFRDSHVDGEGLETVVHEYAVEAVLSPDAATVVSCRATPRVLPWQECPEAAASAARLAGMEIGGLRKRVRAEFVGPSTCTHLNDTLREIDDAAALAALLP